MQKALRGVGIALSGVAFKAAITRSLDFADAIGKAADKVGLSVTAFQQYAFAANQSGISTSQLESNLIAFNKRLGELKGGFGSLKTALEKINPDLAEMMKNAGSTEEALDLFMKTLAGIEDPATRAALAAAAFSRSGVAMTNMVRDGYEAMVALKDKASELGIVLSEEMVRGAEAANDALDILVQVLRVKLVSAIAANAKAIESWASNVVRFVNWVVEGFAYMQEAWIRVNRTINQAKIGDAEKKLQAAGAAAKQVGDELASMAAKYEDVNDLANDPAFPKLVQEYENWGEVIDDQKGRLSGLIGEQLKANSAFTAAMPAMQEIKVETEGAATATEKMGEAADAASKGVKKLAEETKQTAEELAPLADRLAAVNAELDTMMGLDYSGDLFELADGFEAVEESAATAAEATINFSEALEENLSTAIESFLQGDFSGGIDDFVSGFVDDMRKQFADALAKCLIPANLMKDIICGDGASIVSETIGGAIKAGIKKIGGAIMDGPAGAAIKKAGAAIMGGLGIGAASSVSATAAELGVSMTEASIIAGKSAIPAAQAAGAKMGTATAAGMKTAMALAGPAMVAAGVVLAYMSMKGLHDANRKMRQEIRDNYKELLTQGMVEPAREVANELGQIAIESTAVQGLAYTRIGELGVAAYQALREAMQKHGITIAEVKDDFAQITGNVENFDAAVQSVNETQVESIQLMNRLKLKWDDGRGSTEAASLAMRDYNEIMGQVNNATLPQLAAAAVRNLGIAQSESEKLEEIMRDGVVTAAEAASVGIKQMGTKSAAEFSGLLREIEKTMKGIYESTAAANGLKSAIDGLQDKTVTVTTRHVDTYSGAHAASGERATGTYGQFFTVPPGYANDSYRMGLTSGEKVKVQTPGEQEQQGNSGVMSEIRALRFDVRALAERIAAPIVAAAYDTAESPIAV